MKKILNFIIILLFSGFLLYSQEILEFGQGFIQIDFENSNEDKYVGIDEQQIWRIDEPQKEILFLPEEMGYLGDKGIFTDTAYYGNNLNSYFQFKLVLNPVDEYSISFYQKYDFESNKDGGIIETSYDNGVTWQNLIFDTIIQNNLVGTYSMYSLEDTVASYGNQPGFTGTQSEIEIIEFTFKANEYLFGDTLTLRFIISSDDNNNNNEGWLIDAFRFSGITVGLQSNIINNKSLVIYPNPANDVLNIKSNNEYISKVDVLTCMGQKIYTKVGNNIRLINISGLPAGIYILKCNNYKNDEITLKFSKI